ncbi:hypothetical protein ABPG75_010975 [Micractinium tetrahymenae]
MKRRAAPACALAILLLASSGYAVPNLIMLSIDDGVTDSALDTAYTATVVESGVGNPNGCRPPITWCAAHGTAPMLHCDCDAVLQAHSLGHELATHTVTHPDNGESLSYEEWVEVVGNQRSWLAGCGVPEEEVVGFRAPYYVTNSALGSALQDLGFLQSCPEVQKATHSHLFCGCAREVPAEALPGSGGRHSDPQPVDGKSILERLQEDFESKRGSGVPVGIKVHEPYLEDRQAMQTLITNRIRLSNRGEIIAFLRWALGQEDTWAVTYSQYISWIEAGQGSLNGKVLSNSTCDAA